MVLHVPLRSCSSSSFGIPIRTHDSFTMSLFLSRYGFTERIWVYSFLKALFDGLLGGWMMTAALNSRAMS
jgi:hypothetical protein